MAAPVAKLMSEIKTKLLNPSLTSHYAVEIQPPSWKAPQKFYSNAYLQDIINLSCSEASLPGSALMTHELTDDYIGVTEKIAYRKSYDDSLSLTFYVNHDHAQIKFFEGWIRYIAGEPMVGESTSSTVELSTYNHRFRFRSQYASTIYINKFEKDYGSVYTRYKFLDAYPASINSMSLSYDSSQLLKCTINFNFTRYLLNPVNAPRPTEPTPTAPTPTAPTPTPPQPSDTSKTSIVVTNEYYNNGIIRSVDGSGNIQFKQGPGQKPQDATNFTLSDFA
jgi:hypothetical protein